MISDSTPPPPPAPLTRDQLRSRRAREVPKTTVDLKREPIKQRVHLATIGPSREDLAAVDEARPRTRGDCVDGLRPCPFVGCRQHLFLDVQANGNLTLRFPDLEPEELVETCALDVAEHGGESLEAVGELSNCTRERIRQIEARALWKLEKRAPASLRDCVIDEARKQVRKHLRGRGDVE